MLEHILLLPLLWYSFLPAAIAQDGCGLACSNYLIDLKNAASLDTVDVYYTGPITQAAVQAVCGYSDALNCFQCGGTGLTQNQMNILLAWGITCTTFDSAGINPAVDCWNSNFHSDECVIPAGAGSASSQVSSFSPAAATSNVESNAPAAPTTAPESIATVTPTSISQTPDSTSLSVHAVTSSSAAPLTTSASIQGMTSTTLPTASHTSSGSVEIAGFSWIDSFGFLFAIPVISYLMFFL